ncbi:MAG: alpha-glycosidase [Clostridia bacterium]|nr:alpha-glycosidase [Clostridia bacterium]
MILEAFHHVQDIPYAFIANMYELTVRLRVKKDDIKEAYVYYKNRRSLENDSIMQMEKITWDRLHDYYECVVPSKQRITEYIFKIVGWDDQEVWYGDDGPNAIRELAGIFECPYLLERDMFNNIPSWANEAIMYNIFVDRFYNGNPLNDPQGVVPWGETPLEHPYYGGDIEGIIEKLPYLKELGFNTILLSPINTSPIYHKYFATDFFDVDPEFGGIETFKKLMELAHKEGMKVIIDGIVNHCHRDFFAFKDVMEKGQNSEYADWFYIYDFPVVTEPIANYEVLTTVDKCPKFNLDNPKARKYMLEVARFWTEEMKVDGWRLDICNEVDHGFWREFRTIVKGINPDCLIIGEVWHESITWLKGDQFDAITNYKISHYIHSFIAVRQIKAELFMDIIMHSLMFYHPKVNYALANFISSHDVIRITTSCQGWDNQPPIDIAKLYRERSRLAILFQYTYIGVPTTYYGDEVGMEGGMMPDCRRAMVWDESQWDMETLHLHKRLINIRKNSPAIKYGKFVRWIADDEKNTIGYLRCHEQQTIAVIINNSPCEQKIEAKVDWKKNGDYLTDLISDQRFEVMDTMSFTIPPFGYLLLD